MKTIKLFFASLALGITCTFGFGLAAVSAAKLPADPGTPQSSTSASAQNACAGLQEVDPSQGCDGATSTNTLNSLAKSVVLILSWLAGIAAVIFVILAGFKYITSAGDSNKVGSAKTTLIYALVGLVIVVISQALIRFVFTSIK